MPRKLADKLIEIDLSGFLVADDPNPFFKAILEKLKEKIPEAVISNLCKYCQPAMTKAVNKYVANFIVSYRSGGILNHPNFNLSKAPKDYLGALGIPKRYDKKMLQKYLRRAIRVDVKACGAQIDRVLISGARRTKKGAEALREFTKKSAPSTITTVKLDEITELAYKETGFRAGVDGKNKRGSYKRLWLKEADTGETVVSGWDVFPRKGEGLGNFRGTNKSSRSGTHIMIPSEKNYDPNEWRPSPNDNFIIKSIFLSKIPNMQQAAIRAAISCIKKRKRQIAKDVQKNVASEVSSSRIYKAAVENARTDIAEKAEATRNFTNSVNNRIAQQEAATNVSAFLRDLAEERGINVIKFQALVSAQAQAKGLSLEQFVDEFFR